MQKTGPETRTRISRLALPLALAMLLPSVAGAAKVGEAAPAFSLPDTQGKTRTLAEAKGKYVVLEWLNFGCPFVKKHYGAGNMQALQKKYGEKGVLWYSVVSSAPGKEGHGTPAELQKQNAEKKGAQTAVLLDPKGEVGKAYGAKTTPHMYVIDPEGKLIYEGAIDDHPSADPADIPKSKNFVSAALDEAMAGKPVSVSFQKPYGCSVKY
jgi:peroxiredoxin